MEGDKNKMTGNKSKGKIQENEEEVNTVKLNKKNYKVGSVNEIDKKNKANENTESNFYKCIFLKKNISFFC